ncbi:MAG TPA: slipin family protein, partial [Planctomycetota bacterium]|nr:slipin family protein [Planctomycetota bacterium]
MKVIVEAYEKGLKFRDGKFVGVLDPGRHRVRTLFARERIEKIDMRLRTMILQGQEVMTLDKVTIRLSALIQLKVADPAAAVLKVDNYAAQLYGEVQLALRDHIGSVEFDALLQEKGRIGARILEVVKLDAAGYGVDLVDVGIRDLVLPGEMKAILNKVMEARKQAEASMIARREEVAATRSLANTAQLLEKNPVLMRLKELEALEKVAANGGSVVVSPDLFGFARETV